MPIKDLVVKARSHRRFREDAALDPAVLESAVDAARLTPSGSNHQPLRYIVSTSRDMNEKIFPHLGWAGRLKDWKGPAEGERPAGYIVVVADEAHRATVPNDVGIAAQTINLVLAEAGLTACLLGNINARAIHGLLDIPEEFDVALVIAVGAELEKVVIDDMPADGNPAYWREADGTHHVPKRALGDVLLATYK